MDTVEVGPDIFSPPSSSKAAIVSVYLSSECTTIIHLQVAIQ